jgi:hypothetical protein
MFIEFKSRSGQRISIALNQILAVCERTDGETELRISVFGGCGFYNEVVVGDYATIRDQVENEATRPQAIKKFPPPSQQLD